MIELKKLDKTFVLGLAWDTFTKHSYLGTCITFLFSSHSYALSEYIMLGINILVLGNMFFVWSNATAVWFLQKKKKKNVILKERNVGFENQVTLNWYQMIFIDV